MLLHFTPTFPMATDCSHFGSSSSNALLLTRPQTLFSVLLSWFSNLTPLSLMVLSTSRSKGLLWAPRWDPAMPVFSWGILNSASSKSTKVLNHSSIGGSLMIVSPFPPLLKDRWLDSSILPTAYTLLLHSLMNTPRCQVPFLIFSYPCLNLC